MRLLLAVFFLTVCSVLRAADPAGTIAGSIQDPTGSTVANARIAVTSTTTGLTRQVTSGADGSYVLPLLPVGVYNITVEAQGFKSMEQRGIEVRADKNSSVVSVCNSEARRNP